MIEKTAYSHFLRPDPSQKEMLGPIEEEYDELTGTLARYRMARVGMTRNAKPENCTKRTVYLGFDGVAYPPHVRIEKAKPLQGWYKSKSDTRPGTRPRPCYSEALLTEPYGGACPVGCAGCYINAGMRGYRGTGLVTVPVNYGEQIAAQLSKFRTATAGYLSSFTEPFQVLENIYHNTQRCAEAFVAAGLPIFFLSRIAYPGWAIDLLRKSPYSYAQKSLNTGNSKDYQKLSPGALPLEEHIAEIGELRRRGIYTSIQVNPIIPGITPHEDIRALFEQLAAVGNNHVIVKFIEMSYASAPTLIARMKRLFGPERGADFEKLFTENQAGAQRGVIEEYRIEAHQKYSTWAGELGMTYSTCYEYRKRDKYERAGKWTSLGPAFTTSDQCHGQRVPMFTREALSDPFREVVECSSTGCLYCADDNGGAPLCGSSLFGEARALRSPQYKIAIRPDEITTDTGKQK